MLRCRPFRHVIAALGDQPQHGIGAEAVDLTEVGAQQTVQRGAHVEGRFIPPLRVPLPRQGRVRCRFLVAQREQRGFNFLFALRNLGLMEVIQVERLLQREDVLLDSGR